MEHDEITARVREKISCLNCVCHSTLVGSHGFNFQRMRWVRDKSFFFEAVERWVTTWEMLRSWLLTNYVGENWPNWHVTTQSKLETSCCLTLSFITLKNITCKAFKRKWSSKQKLLREIHLEAFFYSFHHWT